MHQHQYTRRRIVQRVAGMGFAGAGLAVLAGCRGGASDTQTRDVEPPPETTQLRMFQTPALCPAPQYFAVELLKAEGFTDVQVGDHMEFYRKEKVERTA